MSRGTIILRQELEKLEKDYEKTANVKQRGCIRVKIRSLEKDITILEYAKEHMNILG